MTDARPPGPQPTSKPASPPLPTQSGNRSWLPLVVAGIATTALLVAILLAWALNAGGAR